MSVEMAYSLNGEGLRAKLRGDHAKLAGTLVCAREATPPSGRLVADDSDLSLYRPARFAPRGPAPGGDGRPVPASLIPYFARLNRTGDFFRIWLPVD